MTLLMRCPHYNMRRYSSAPPDVLHRDVQLLKVWAEAMEDAKVYLSYGLVEVGLRHEINAEAFKESLRRRDLLSSHIFTLIFSHMYVPRCPTLCNNPHASPPLPLPSLTSRACAPRYSPGPAAATPGSCPGWLPPPLRGSRWGLEGPCLLWTLPGSGSSSCLERPCSKHPQVSYIISFPISYIHERTALFRFWSQSWQATQRCSETVPLSSLSLSPTWSQPGSTCRRAQERERRSCLPR